jgi:hypothetical protein
VRLGPGGNVTGLELITDDEWPGLWIVRNGNQNFFPVCRLGFRTSDRGWSSKDAALLGRLQRKAKELKLACGGHDDLDRVITLTDRFLIATAHPKQLHDQLRQQTSELLKDDGARYQFAFDVDQDTVYRTGTRDAVGRALPDGDRSVGSHPATACAYTGGNNLQMGPFPTVKLPVLNKAFPLVSMFSEAACNRRYDLTDSSVVPVATNVALEIQNALSFIVKPEREGRTWRGVCNGHFEKSGGRQREQLDLLIAYVQGGVILPARIASLFGAAPDGEIEQFEADASAVCEALDGIARQEPASRLNIFVLRRVSEGQAQVQLSAQPTVRDIISAAESWKQGGKNIPAVLARVPASKGSGQMFLRPLTPRPDRLVSITSRQWMESGKRWSSSQGANFSQVLNVMLKGYGCQVTATDLLGLTVSRTWPLMMGLFGTLLRLGPANSTRHGYSPQSCRHAMLVTSALGILLYALDCRKEEYMHEAPFLVGRLLALADVLHREHSRHERNAEPPPQMIGNALMPVARDNPTAAVARLIDRLPLYEAWAERSGDGLARWAVSRIRATATELGNARLPTSANEADRAQLILGYISRLSDSGSEEEGEQEPSGGQDE